MWRVYIKPIFDYGCQLWSPTSQGDIIKMEDVLRNYTARAHNNKLETEKFNFWQRISLFNVRSQQRRQERFMIIYTWKIMEEFAPNCGLVWEQNKRTGRTCMIQNITREASTKVRSLRNSSFQIRGPVLFNSMPLELRNLSGCSVNSFKNRLDALLKMLPDTPSTQKYYPVPTNRHTSKTLKFSH